MKLNEALAAFPARSAYRRILPRMFSRTEQARTDAVRELGTLDEPEDGAMKTTWAVSERDARALLEAATGLGFPRHPEDREDPVHGLIFHLVRSPHRGLVPLARSAYANLSDRAKCAALALIAATRTRAGAEAFVSCIREHGWPKHVYGRVFIELWKLLRFSDILFPELILRAGSQISGVIDLLLGGMAEGKLRLGRGKIDLEPIAPLALKRLSKSLKLARAHQRRRGVAWKFKERYGSIRGETGAWLDIAGYLKGREFDRPLRQALAMPDPRIAAFAAGAVMRRGGTVPPLVLRRVAACHETRPLIFGLLRDLGRSDLFPRSFRTWDAFAASNMVDWLITEEGSEPEILEKEAVYRSGKGARAVSVYLWRFSGDDGKSYAGISGPYSCRGEPAPVHGDLTFSRYDRWESETVEKHAEANLETIGTWRRAWARRRPR